MTARSKMTSTGYVEIAAAAGGRAAQASEHRSRCHTSRRQIQLIAVEKEKFRRRELAAIVERCCRTTTSVGRTSGRHASGAPARRRVVLRASLFDTRPGNHHCAPSMLAGNLL